MAERSKRGGAKLYGKSPTIAAQPDDGDAVDTQGGAPAGAADAAAETAGAPEPQGAMNTDNGPEGDVMAGTDHIPTHHHEQSRERAEMHHRHMAEHHEMHHRHEREHLMRAMGAHHEKHHEMNDRHEEERRKMHTRHEKEHREMNERHEESAGKEGPTGGMKDKSEGKGGTEPKK